MDLAVRKEGEVIFLKPLSKNIDGTVITTFKSRVTDLINQGNELFILNLSEVDFIDSSGLGAIISILKTLTLNNGNLVLCGLQSSILSLFKLTRMNLVFKICSDEKEALSQLLETKKGHVH